MHRDARSNIFVQQVRRGKQLCSVLNQLLSAICTHTNSSALQSPMSFLTIHKIINSQRLKFAPSSRFFRLYACGRFFSVPHFYLDFAQINQDPLTFKLQSPLFQLTIARHKIPFAGTPTPRERQARASNRTWLVSMNSTASKRAHSSKLVNRNREAIFRILNDTLEQAKDRNLVSLYMLPACAVASPQQIAKHVRQALSKYLGKPITDASYHPKSIFGYFDQFNIERWRSNSHIKSLFDKAQTRSSPTSFSIYCCHFYRLQSALQPLEMIADMRTLQQVLAKFNFFEFIPRLRPDDLPKSTVLCRRFVRTLKWRSSQSEDYLVFLLNQFGHASMTEALFLFEQVAQEYCRNKR